MDSKQQCLLIGKLKRKLKRKPEKQKERREARAKNKKIN